MPRKAKDGKVNQPIVSKHDVAELWPISVTHPAKETQNVTRRSGVSPLKCYARLEPWLRFANLPDDPKSLHQAYIQQFASRPIGSSPPVFFQLTTAVRLMRGGESRKLIETYRDVRDFLECIPAMEPRESGAFAADEEMQFPMMLYASRTENGRICFQPEPLRWAFKAALDGAETRRIRRCPICSKFFYAVRGTQKACSPRCNATRRVRAWRAKQAQYEYKRKLRSAGLKPKGKEES
jgi:hypothetical protein